MDWYPLPQNDTPPAPPPPSKGRCFGRAVLPPALHMLIQFAVAFVVIFFAMISLFYIAAQETGEIPQIDAQEFLSSPVYARAIMDGVLYSGFISAGLFFWMYKRNLRKERFAPMRPPGASSVLFLVAVIAVAGNFTLVAGVTAVQDFLGTDLPTSSLDGVTEGVNPLILLLSVCFAAPVAEELCFRGLAFRHLLRGFPFWKANMIQAALFGVIHITPVQVGYAFLFGLLLGWIFHRTGRFGAVVLAHIVFNFANFLFALIPHAESLTEDPSRLLLYVGLPAAAVLALGIRRLGAATAAQEA